MSEKLRVVNLYCDKGTSDKVYDMWIEKKDGKYVVAHSYGPRLGGRTVGENPKTAKDSKRAVAGSLERAEEVYASKLSEQLGKGYVDITKGAGKTHELPANKKPDENLGVQLLAELPDLKSCATRVLNDDYAVQKKIDGKRIILVCERSGVTAFNRSSTACGISSEVAEAAKKHLKKAATMILDGEVIGDVYHVFDLLALDGRDIRGEPFKNRLELLAAQLNGNGNGAIRRVPTIIKKAAKVAAVRQFYLTGEEGAAVKRLSAPYIAGRSLDQIKLKWTTDSSLIVLKHNERSSMQMCAFDDNGKLVEVGNCSIRDSRFAGLKEGAVVDIRYLHVYPDSNHIYQGRMLKVRDDVKPEECKLSRLHYKGAPREDVSLAGV